MFDSARWNQCLVNGRVVSVGCELLEDLVLHTIRGVALVSVMFTCQLGSWRCG